MFKRSHLHGFFFGSLRLKKPEIFKELSYRNLQSMIVSFALKNIKVSFYLLNTIINISDYFSIGHFDLKEPFLHIYAFFLTFLFFFILL